MFDLFVVLILDVLVDLVVCGLRGGLVSLFVSVSRRRFSVLAGGFCAFISLLGLEKE